MSKKEISIGVLILILVIIMVYSLVMYELFRRQSFIFAPYEPPAPPADLYPFHPLGNVTPMTQEEIDTRNQIIIDSTAAAA